MKKILILATSAIIVLVFSVYLGGRTGVMRDSVEELDRIEEQDIDICRSDFDCIVVPYNHCCGSTKRAIDKKYLELYQSKPEWQTFKGSCHLMGLCPDDSHVTQAACERRNETSRCLLKY